jgi:hypothetical protein
MQVTKEIKDSRIGEGKQLDVRIKEDTKNLKVIKEDLWADYWGVSTLSLLDSENKLTVMLKDGKDSARLQPAYSCKLKEDAAELAIVLNDKDFPVKVAKHVIEVQPGAVDAVTKVLSDAGMLGLVQIKTEYAVGSYAEMCAYSGPLKDLIPAVVNITRIDRVTF